MPVHIIGTSHIARESVREIKRYLEEEKPELIALELDLQRAAALMNKQPQRLSLLQGLRIGLKGYLFALIGRYVQQKLGKMVGVSPGAEMKAALQAAQKNRLEVALIDQPLPVTLKKLSRRLSWREKGRFLADMLSGMLFPRRQLRKYGLEEFDLTKVPALELIKSMMQLLQKRYPSVYYTLVEERNQYMARQLQHLQQKHPEKRILAVVGAGHVEGMREIMGNE